MPQKWFSTHNDETHLIFYKKKTPKSSYNHRRRNRRNTEKFLMHTFFWDTLYYADVILSCNKLGCRATLDFSFKRSDPDSP